MPFVDFPQRIMNAIKSGDTLELLRPVSDFFTANGEPIECPFCRSKKINEKPRAFEQGVPSESDYVCEECEKYVTEWVQGYFNTDYIRYAQEYINECIEFYNNEPKEVAK